MRKIILTDKPEKIYENEIPDIVDFNKDMLTEGFEKIKSFEVYSKGHEVRVDLENADIIIDGKILDLEVDEATKTQLKTNQLKWINFRRVTKSYRMAGNISTKNQYGIGFQGLIDGVNIKRFILVDREKVELRKV